MAKLAASVHFQQAFDALKNACLKGKTKKTTSKSIDELATAVAILSTSPLPFPYNRLESSLRRPLVSLYHEQAELALAFAASVAKVGLQQKLKPRIQSRKQDELEEYHGWEKIMHSLLSGIIDYLEDQNKADVKSRVGSMFLKLLCDYFFPKSIVDVSKMSVSLRCSAYLLISDIATQHSPNQSLLRDYRTLGGGKLGKAIAASKDYAVLESLLNLFARLLPPSTDQSKRLSFIKSVFINSGQFVDHGKEIADLLQTQSVKDWEAASMKIVQIMSRADISMPQPFDVDDVVVCGIRCPQVETSDKFFVDRTSFFVNAKQEDGMYESMQIYFNTISNIDILNEQGNVIVIRVSLTDAPMLADKSIAPEPPLDVNLLLTTKILREDQSRFVNALQYRSMGSLIADSAFVRSAQRVSVTQTSAVLENDDPEAIDKPPLSKIQDVEKFYDAVSVRSLAQTSGHSVGKSATSEMERIEPQENCEPNEAAARIYDFSSRAIDDSQPPAVVAIEVATVIDGIPITTTLPFDGESSLPTEMTSAPVFDDTVGVDAVSRVLEGTKYANKATKKKDQNTKEESHAYLARRKMTGASLLGDSEYRPVAVGIVGQAAQSEVTLKKMKIKNDKSTTSQELRKCSASAVAASVNNIASPRGDGDTAVHKPSRILAVARKSSASDAIVDLSSNDELSKPTVDRKRKMRNVINEGDETDGLTPPPAKKPHVQTKQIMAKTTYADVKNRGEKNIPHETSPLAEKVDYDNPPSEAAIQEVPPSRRMPTRGKAVAKSRRGNNRHPAVTKVTPGKASTHKPTKRSIQSKPNTKHIAEQKMKKWPTSKVPVTSAKRRPLQELTTHTQRIAAGLVQADINGSAPPVSASSIVEPLIVKDTRSDNGHRPLSKLGADADKRLGIAMVDDAPSPFTERKTSHFPTIVTHHLLTVSSSPKQKGVGLELEEIGPVNDLMPDQIRKERGHKGAGVTIIDLTSDSESKPMSFPRTDVSMVEHTPGALKERRKRLPSVDSELSEEELTHVPEQQRVTFDETLRYKSVSMDGPRRYESDTFSLPNHMAGDKLGRDRRSRPPMTTKPTQARVQHTDDSPRYGEHILLEPGMKDFIAVLNEIQYAVVENLVDKSRGARSDVRIARNKLIQDAVQDLEEMREESIGHLENLLLIETNYASFGHAIAGEYDDALKDLQHARVFIQQTMTMHDRSSLSRTMPPSLFSASLPAVFGKHS